MNYKFTTYKEGYIESQFLIGSGIYDKWRMGGQTRPEQLKVAYTGADFDPETKFYAFIENEMVAFLTSTEKKDEENKSAFFEFPFIKKGYDDVLDQLIQYAFEKLRKKDFKILITRAGHYWGKTKSLADDYGFELKNDIIHAGELHLDEIDTSTLEYPKDLLSFNAEKDIDDLAEIFASRFNIPVEKMKKNISRFKDLQIGQTIINPWNQELTLVTNVVGRVDGKLVARAVAMNAESYGSKNVNIISFYVKDGYEKMKSQLIRKIMEDCKDQEYHRLIVHTGLWGSHPEDSYFEEFGFKFLTKLAYYHKNL
ncbi:MAG: hypothetical protein HeimC2_44240 [Candidatus Heimdallarchaeota archaeon LC_2]|nr:MAG: hypothetical protein HeimC2_44240 [Candidatus Heimdallarchaeota archaeon LC_2]